MVSNKLKFSVITICYNDFEGVKSTLESVLSQSYIDYESIVIDGGSNDGTSEYLKKHADNVLWLSEPDSGIYNAMNKGIGLASGDWLIFMNSGDKFSSSNVLADVSAASISRDINAILLYGDVITKGQIIKAKEPREVLLKGGLFACHQSMFFRPNIQYDESYYIFGDFELVARLFKKHPSAFHYLNFLISDYEGGGVSSNISWKTRREKLVSIYKHLGFKGIFISYLLMSSFWSKLFALPFKKFKKIYHGDIN